ncbi:MAG TPA: hypothetical protein VMA98_00020 [Candidatus Acidoferrales bacterium]|nr:hypothetical protein [Candidatus Acidoferrales bacterium]
MVIDPIEALKALARSGVRTARSKYVDSAEDALAFAERRNARDPRFVPIVLRTAGETADGHPLASEDAVRRAYDRLANGSRRILAQIAEPTGELITVIGETTPAGDKMLAVQGHMVRRRVPIGAAGAEAIALDVHAYGHREPPKTRKLLEHLLLRLSNFFDRPGIDAIRVLVHLHDNSYTVTDVAATGSHQLHLPPKLGKRGHDRKGDEYHPAGRQ